MTITYHDNITQGSEEWHAIRCGRLTASEMSLILTPTLKQASNDKERMHLFELLAQRIQNYVEPAYIGDDMLRGFEDEIKACDLYSKLIAPTKECGFITNDRWGFVIGYSPDRLVGDDGLLECKSRKQKYQVQTIAKLEVPTEHILQVQTGLLVSERKWLDFVSFSAGLPMMVLRVWPDEKIHAAIVEASQAFEARLSEMHKAYLDALSSSGAKFIPTKREEIIDGIEDPFAGEYE